jgi:hypothetical protein
VITFGLAFKSIRRVKAPQQYLHHSPKDLLENFAHIAEKKFQLKQKIKKLLKK